MLKLIGRFLRAGVYEGWRSDQTGARGPAGRSPFAVTVQYIPRCAGQRAGVARIVILPYADDCNIYVGSPAAAERVFASITAWIEKHLKGAR